ncbi:MULTISPECIES: hypothetical protein [Natrialbaceae]|uniref:hypothetical protein n=1 Tax=Natrialbaceae TaxID=1644061 RepID=UPI00207D0AA7|nr:hypothetical protein [Natronococcus sp. CG52]
MSSQKDRDLMNATRYGDEIAVWVKKNTGYKELIEGKDSPIVSVEEVADEFDLSEDEAREKLIESEFVHSREVGDIQVFF